MPATLSGLQFKYQISKQTAEGAFPTTYDYSVPVWAGGLQPTQDVQPFAVADVSNARPGFFKKTASVGGSITFGSFPDSDGWLAYQLLGTQASAGGSAPWTFTLTAAEPLALWATIAQNRPAAAGAFFVERYEDCTITGLEWQYVAGEPLKVVADIVGKTATNSVTALTKAVAPALDLAYLSQDTGSVSPNDFVTAISPTLKMDVAASPAVTTLTNFESLNLKITRETEMLQTQELTPRFRKQGLIDVAFTGTLIWVDYNAYRNSYFGSASGTTLSANFPIGALDLSFPSVQSGRSVEIIVPAIQIMADPSEVDPAGGAVRVQLSGFFQKPASGAVVTVKSINDRGSGATATPY